MSPRQTRFKIFETIKRDENARNIYNTDVNASVLTE